MVFPVVSVAAKTALDISMLISLSESGSVPVSGSPVRILVKSER
jgi:hypothetical protein